MTTISQRTLMTAIEKILPPRDKHGVPRDGTLILGPGGITIISAGQRTDCGHPDLADLPDAAVDLLPAYRALHQHGRAWRATVTLDITEAALTISADPDAPGRQRLRHHIPLVEQAALADPDAPMPMHALTAAEWDNICWPAFAAETDDTLPVLTRVQIRDLNGHLVAAATDRYRLAYADVADQVVPGWSVEIPATDLVAFAALAGASPVTIYGPHDDNAWLQTTTPDGYTIERGVPAQSPSFPRWPGLIEDTSDAITCPREPLAKAIARTAALTPPQRACHPAGPPRTMNRLTAWWRRLSPWRRAWAAEHSRALWEEMYLRAERDLRAERERNEHLTGITRGDQADLQSLAEQLGRAWDARDSARRVAVTLDNENRCATDLLRTAYDTLAKLAGDPPEAFTRSDQDLHYWIGAFLRTQETIPAVPGEQPCDCDLLMGHCDCRPVTAGA